MSIARSRRVPDERDWPHRTASRFVRVDGLRLHVQVMGEGEDLLLIHGTGASSHSWRDVMPVLARHYRVIAPDLPGHGLSLTPANGDLSLPGMSKNLKALLSIIEVNPAAAVGHSAGAAIAIVMAAQGMIMPHALIGINAALKPFGGPAAQIFPAMARLLFINPFMPRFFAWRAQDESAVRRLIDGTGSRLTPEGLSHYQKLFADSDHVAATLGMMANWDLSTIDDAISRLPCPLTLMVGEKDKAVSPEEARALRKRHSGTRLISLPGLGHLAHEEQPDAVAAQLLAALAAPEAQP